eukprot:TRINITY_DN80439_c0_g1_i1.p1 TRINITY_DN80439_c0_g1~~TRINITY_DN80439_c0_g1_i1.p1  ORF type:complete len:475 (+),score=111.82 TRINITY_DN80439_c0_g1_i1:125-1549(+)
MSWRAESTFKPTSSFAEDEKEFLKLAKKIRDILKLEDRVSQGEKLDQKQQEKISAKSSLLKEVQTLAGKLPGDSDAVSKAKDITDLLPSSVQRDIEKKRKQDEERKQARQARQEEERRKPEFMSRHDRPILDVCVSSDCKHLYTCSKDKYVICWSMEKQLLKSVVTFAGHQGAVWAVDVCAPASPAPAWLITGSADGKVLLWQADPGQHRAGTVAAPAQTFEHGGIVRVLRWCPFDDEQASTKGRRFASASEKLGSKPPQISVFAVSPKGSFTEIVKITELPTKANDLRWGGGAKTKLFSAHDNGFVGVWLAEAPGSLLKTIKVHTSPISSLCLTSDGTTLVTSSHDHSSKAVDVSTPSTEVLATYEWNRPLNAVCVSADFKVKSSGHIVIAGGKDPRDVTRAKDLREDEFEAKVMDATSSDAVAAGKGHFGPIHTLLSLPRLGSDGAFASASEDGCLKVHGLDGKLLHSDTLQ